MARTALFVGNSLNEVVALITAHGLTGTQKILAVTGVRMGGTECEPMEVSLGTLQNIAKAHGIVGKRGRPAGSGGVKAEKPVVSGKPRGRPAGSGKKSVGEFPLTIVDVFHAPILVVESVSTEQFAIDAFSTQVDLAVPQSMPEDLDFSDEVAETTVSTEVAEVAEAAADQAA